MKRKSFTIKRQNQAKLLKKELSRADLEVVLVTENLENNSDISMSWISRSTYRKQLLEAIISSGKLIRTKSKTPKKEESSQDRRSFLRSQLRNIKAFRTRDRKSVV